MCVAALLHVPLCVCTWAALCSPFVCVNSFVVKSVPGVRHSLEPPLAPAQRQTHTPRFGT